MNELVTIVIAAYNRPLSLKRLLDSLNNAIYKNQKVNLVISIDFSGDNKVLQLADSFEWNFGEKTVIDHQENMGLKKHILYCGDLTQNLGNIILLEDDLYVSPYFLDYSNEAISYFNNDSKIAGISLYNHVYNETSKLPFSAAKLDSHDNYFMQLPSSWGQIWTINQWKAFKKWFNDTDGNYNFNILPDNIKKWPESSWKKLFSLYMLEKNRFFVYPFNSLSTNFGDSGVNFWKNNNQYQAPLLYSELKYSFSSLEDSFSIYDSYCENVSIEKKLEEKNICIDIYGSKFPHYMNYDYVLTTKKLNLEIISSYGLNLKPLETNIFQSIKGEDIKLYRNSSGKINNQSSKIKDRVKLMNYYYPGLNLQKIMTYLSAGEVYIDLIKKIMKKI